MNPEDKTKDPILRAGRGDTDQGRRQALKTLGKAAYVAPAVTLMSLDALTNPAQAASGTGLDIACLNPGASDRNPNCR